MIDLPAAWVAEAAGGILVAGDPATAGPRRAVVDSRELAPGDLFFGLRGQRIDGGGMAMDALERGAWGVVVAPEWAEQLGAEVRWLAEAGEQPGRHGGEALAPEARPPAVIAADDPRAALARLARAWRRELGCPCVGVTGSTGKTSTKDILAAILAASRRTHANRQNLNTEIGLPLSLLEAERGTEALVLEMAMRGPGQIAELVSVAEPQVGVIVNVGPVHLELLGTVERVAAAKAELIRDLPSGAGCVVPAGERLLAEHLREDLDTITFGPGGDVTLSSFADGRALIDARGTEVELELPYSEPHNLLNTLAAVAAATALGVTPSGRVEARFSSLRGEVLELPGGVTVVNDCYNANPMSMRAALEHLAATPAERRIAVLGAMAELGPGSERFHRQIGRHAANLGIDVLVTVRAGGLPYTRGFRGEVHAAESPEDAALLLETLTRPGDRVLIKGSRSAALERVLAGRHEREPVR